jgi:hypothetical protein
MLTLVTLVCDRQQSGLPLSTLLGRTPNLFDERKISVVERNIACLDTLPGRFWTIERLYCSKNRLRSLEGVQQFKSLRMLSVSDNYLGDFLDLDAVAAVAGTLEAASFEGNPICRLPNYRAQVGPMGACRVKRGGGEQEQANM